MSSIVQYDPLVSIVMPAYNYSRFITEALASLMQQTYRNWECLVIDDGSTDNTQEIVAAYATLDARIIYIHQANAGVSAARNNGMNRAKGEYFHFLDADDLIEPDKLAAHVKILKEHPEIDLVYSDMTLFRDENGQRTFTSFTMPDVTPVSGSGAALVDGLLVDNFFLTCCALFRRTMWEKTGGFKVGLRGLEDWHFWYRGALLGCTYFHDQGHAGVNCLIRTHTTSATQDYKMMVTHRIFAREDIVALLQRNDPAETGTWSAQPVLLKKLVYHHQAIIYEQKVKVDLLFNGNYLQGLKDIIRQGWYSGKPFKAIYSGLHWVKMRFKK